MTAEVEDEAVPVRMVSLAPVGVLVQAAQARAGRALQRVVLGFVGDEARGAEQRMEGGVHVRIGEGQPAVGLGALARAADGLADDHFDAPVGGVGDIVSGADSELALAAPDRKQQFLVESLADQRPHYFAGAALGQPVVVLV